MKLSWYYTSVILYQMQSQLQIFHKMSIKYLLFKIIRFKFFVMHTLKWHMICGYSWLFYPAKNNILGWFSFVFYYSVTCLTGNISVYKLVTICSFCGSRSQVVHKKTLHKTQVFFYINCKVNFKFYTMLYFTSISTPDLKIQLHASCKSCFPKSFMSFLYLMYYVYSYFAKANDDGNDDNIQYTIYCPCTFA